MVGKEKNGQRLFVGTETLNNYFPLTEKLSRPLSKIENESYPQIEALIDSYFYSNYFDSFLPERIMFIHRPFLPPNFRETMTEILFEKYGLSLTCASNEVKKQKQKQKNKLN